MCKTLFVLHDLYDLLSCVLFSKYNCISFKLLDKSQRDELGCYSKNKMKNKK